MSFYTTKSLLTSLGLAISLGLSGCNSSAADNATPNNGAAPSVNTTSTVALNSTAIEGTSLVVNPSSLTLAEMQTLLFVREEEKLARDVYLTLYDTWKQRTFFTIAVNSEQTHMDTIKQLLDAYGLTDPVISDTVGSFTDPALAALYAQLVQQGLISLEQGLKVGAYIEEYDLNDIQEAITQTQENSNQQALIQAYENLACGSRNHLRSFVKQLERLGISYTAQLMPQATVDLILDSPTERCGL